MSDRIYQVGSGNVAFNPGYSSTYPNSECALTKNLYYFKESTRTWEPYTDLPFVTLANTVAGTVTLNYSVGSFTGTYSAPYSILTYLMKYTIEDPRSASTSN